MKILHLHDEIWDSGLAHYALTLAAALQERGHEVHFWAAYGSFAAKRARELGLPTREIGSPWASLWALRREVRAQRFEILNAHTGSSHALAAALAAGRRDWAVVRTRADARPPSNGWGARRVAKRTALFIAANSILERQLRDAFPLARVRRIPQGIAGFAQPLKPLPGAPAAGLLGRLDEVKGHDDFLDAAVLVRKQFPQAAFLAAGTGRAERLSKLRWQAEFLGLGKSLRFLERVPDAAEFIDSCSVGVVASRGSEAVSRAALEWMSRGRPVVATSVGGLPDVVVHGETGILIPPKSPAILAQAVGALFADPDFARRMGENGLRRFEARFSLEPFTRATLHAYEDALAARRAGRPEAAP